ncbi:hypothetical protein UFOVP1309_2 [uncultured Caudovirales phage]|uniref:Uncharacterized protein n=1 Tax=uncultured Caudovirales phage TaxID=2100421 RepID=A0A6J5RYG9_9CAUD|nr:hypothetical protein UFOVP1309_2 [uncultured Caudovirales phage]
MTNSKFIAAVEQCEARMQELTPAQMANAMINLDRLAPSFGKSAQEFRTWKFTERVENETEWDPVTPDQFGAYIAHKRAMINAHPYIAQR